MYNNKMAAQPLNRGSLKYAATANGRTRVMKWMSEANKPRSHREVTKPMNAKDYLNRAHKLDKRIDSKLEQVASLRELATKATAVLSHEPKGSNKNIHAMENNIVKIMDLENEISADIDALLDLKHEIGDVIDLVPDTDCQLLLEYRYVSLKTWEDICILLNYSWSGVHKLHNKALRSIEEYLKMHECGLR